MVTKDKSRTNKTKSQNKKTNNSKLKPWQIATIVISVPIVISATLVIKHLLSNVFLIGGAYVGAGLVSLLAPSTPDDASYEASDDIRIERIIDDFYEKNPDEASKEPKNKRRAFLRDAIEYAEKEDEKVNKIILFNYCAKLCGLSGGTEDVVFLEMNNGKEKRISEYEIDNIRQ